MAGLTREALEDLAKDLPEEEDTSSEEDTDEQPRETPASKRRRQNRREEPVEEPDDCEEDPAEFEEDIDDDWDDTEPTVYNLEDVFKKYWRPIAAYVYLAICLFDFIAMPIYKEMQRDSVNTQAFVEVMKIKDKDVQLKALEQLELNRPEWHPITLEGGGLFHISFGAILGVAAWTRGAEKRAAMELRTATRNGYGYGQPPIRRRY